MWDSGNVIVFMRFQQTAVCSFEGNSAVWQANRQTIRPGGLPATPAVAAGLYIEGWYVMI